MPRPYYLQKKTTVTIEQEDGWAPGAGVNILKKKKISCI
jgi:hypothetical protein